MSTLTEALSAGKCVSSSSATIAANITENKVEDDSTRVAIQQDKIYKLSSSNKTATKMEDQVDEDEDINNKLCTYTITKKDFMNQHW